MVTMSAGRLAELVEGSVVYGSADTMFSGLAIDSREVAQGFAFVAFPGDHADGTSFVPAAVRAGARVCVVTRWDDELAATVDGAQVAVVLTEDAAEAVRRIATHHRARLRCPVVAITGSTGKTTTKDFLASALSTTMRVVATSGNRNNELGVPLTVLEADADTEVLVVEMGMRGTGQIEALCAIARPDGGTRDEHRGDAHWSCSARRPRSSTPRPSWSSACRPTAPCSSTGTTPCPACSKARSHAPVTWYGLAADADIRATDIEVDEIGRPTLTLVTREDEVRVKLPVPGRHNAYTAAAATAVARHLGVPLAKIGEGLAAAKTTDMRMEVFTAANGITVVNDAYNANRRPRCARPFRRCATCGRRGCVSPCSATWPSWDRSAIWRTSVSASTSRERASTSS